MANLNIRMTKKEWENLPPLVPKGADRDQVLDEIVAAWCTPLPKGTARKTSHENLPGVALNRVALIDANTNEPIDLGDLLRRVEARIEKDSPSNDDFTPRPDLCITLRACRIDLCNCTGIRLAPGFVTYGLRFGDSASFESATFGDMASFESATFGNNADFQYATFGCFAGFQCAKFGDSARFWEAKFGDSASFEHATFGDGASFQYVTFGDNAGFRYAKFGCDARFGGAKFGHCAILESAKFGDGANFESATFGCYAGFQHAKFGDGVNFESATFGHVAGFQYATFGHVAGFQHAKFGDGASFESATFGDKPNLEHARLCGASFRRVDLRHARFGNVNFAKTRTTPQRLKRLRSKWFDIRWGFNWNVVRAFGELHVLTRVSYLALLIVPLLAGAWPAGCAGVNLYNHAVTRTSDALNAAADRWEALEAQVEQGPLHGPPARLIESDLSQLAKQRVHQLSDKLGHDTLDEPLLPRAWALAFFAALAVAGGHVIYQTRAPDLIKDFSREDWTKKRADDFSEVGTTGREDRLNRAMEWMRVAEERMPYHRHRNFVRRHGEIVWVPSELEFFEDPEVEGEPISEAPGEPDGEDSEAEKKIDAKGRVKRGAYPPVYSASQRRRIAVEEGAFAEYDVCSRETIKSARASAGFYAVGAILIAAIVLDQGWSILRSTRWFGAG